MLEMEKIGLDIVVGGILMRNRKGFAKAGEISFQGRMVVIFCVDRMVLEIKIGIHFFEVGIINRSCHVRSPFRMATGIVHKEILRRMARINERILQKCSCWISFAYK